MDWWRYCHVEHGDRVPVQGVHKFFKSLGATEN